MRLTSQIALSAFRDGDQGPSRKVTKTELLLSVPLYKHRRPSSNTLEVSVSWTIIPSLTLRVAARYCTRSVTNGFVHLFIKHLDEEPSTCEGRHSLRDDRVSCKGISFQCPALHVYWPTISSLLVWWWWSRVHDGKKWSSSKLFVARVNDFYQRN